MFNIQILCKCFHLCKRTKYYKRCIGMSWSLMCFLPAQKCGAEERALPKAPWHLSPPSLPGARGERSPEPRDVSLEVDGSVPWLGWFPRCWGRAEELFAVPGKCQTAPWAASLPARTGCPSEQPHSPLFKCRLHVDTEPESLCFSLLLL